MVERYRLHIIFVLLLALMEAAAPDIAANVPWGAVVPGGIIPTPEDEAIFIHTDRYRYISGETVWFSIYVTSTTSGKLSTASSLAWVELFNPRNQPVARKRFLLAGGRGDGTFKIPDTASSGTYTIRACTKPFAAPGEANFCNVEISVVNALGSLTYIEKVETEAYSGSNQFFPLTSPGRTISLEYDTVIGRRSKVKIAVVVNDPGAGTCQMSLSVAASSAMDNAAASTGQKITAGTGKGNRTISANGNIENSFHMLRLAVKRTGDNHAKLPEHIYMSVQGKVAEFGYGTVDSAGICMIPLPVDSRERTLILQPAKPANGIRLELLQSFPVDSPGIESAETILTDSLADIFSALSFNRQVSVIYGQKVSEAGEAENLPDRKIRRFYGIPEMEIRLDDYIRLPSMQEVFFELLPGINFVNRRGEYKMLISNPLTGEFYNDSPLVMIDGVIINDLKTVADLDPGSVERIEVVKTPYLYGDLKGSSSFPLITATKQLGKAGYPT